MAGSILTSDEINARIVSSFGYSPFATSPYADRVAGDVANFAGAWGPGAAHGGASLMGLDPMMLGFGAASAAFKSSGSILGAGLAGLGAAGLSATVGTLGSFAFQQGMVGAQQQQHLNAALRQNYFQMGNRGQGFGREQQTQIGGMLREMSLQMGPGGELNSMRELTGATSQMAQLGLARGVRDVQDFSRRFKEMVTAATSIARDLGTTLEGGIHAMKGMQGMGIFGAANQMQFSAAARQAGLAGGMGMPEVLQAAAMGSQISRAVGGRGSQGALAGLRVAGMVSSAVASGSLTESQIYNATGYDGAAGRAAIVQQQLSGDASFLRSSRGRRFVAAYVGKNGSIDGAAIDADDGNLSVEETRVRDSQSLARVGRANFLRFEGRARGNMLEKYGGTIQARAMQGWAAGKGIDLFNMDDKETLWAQRQFGMGEDQLSVNISMLKNLPQLRAQQDDVRMNDEFLRNRAEKVKKSGIEGMSTRVELARRRITDGFQEIGAHLYQDLADQVDRLMERTAGGYEAAATSYMDELHSKMGTGEGQAAMGKQLKSVFSVLSGANGGRFSNAQQLARLTDTGGLTGAFMRFSEGKGTNLDTLRGAGFGIDGMLDSPDKAMGYLSKVSQGYRTFQAGEGVNAELLAASKGQGQVIRDFYSSTKAQGADVPAAMAAYLALRARSATGDQAKQLDRMQELVGLGGSNLGGFSSTMAQIGGNKDLVSSVTYGKAAGLLGTFENSGRMSLRDRSDAYTRSLTGGKGLERDVVSDAGGTALRMLGSTVASTVTGAAVGGLPGAIIGGVLGLAAQGAAEWGAYSERTTSEAEAVGAREVFESESFRRTNLSAFSTDKGVRDAARQELKNSSEELTKRSRLVSNTSDEYKSIYGKYNTNQDALMSSVAAEVLAANPNATDEELRTALVNAGVDKSRYEGNGETVFRNNLKDKDGMTTSGFTPKTLRERITPTMDLFRNQAGGEAYDVITGLSDRMASHARAQEGNLVTGNFLTRLSDGRTEISKSAREFIAGGSGSDSAGLRLARKVSGTYEDQLAPANEDPDAKTARVARASRVDGEVRAELRNMSTADLDVFVNAQAGVGASDLDLSRYGASLRSMHRRVEGTYGKSVKKKGKAGGTLDAMSASLGIGLDEDATKEVNDFIKKGDYDSAARVLANSSGSSALAGASEDQRKGISAALKAGATGDTSAYGTELTKLLTDLGEKLQNEREDTDPKVRLQKEANKLLGDIAANTRASGTGTVKGPPPMTPGHGGQPGLNMSSASGPGVSG